jgi:hypothetical protein
MKGKQTIQRKKIKKKHERTGVGYWNVVGTSSRRNNYHTAHTVESALPYVRYNMSHKRVFDSIQRHGLFGYGLGMTTDDYYTDLN